MGGLFADTNLPLLLRGLESTRLPTSCGLQRFRPVHKYLVCVLFVFLDRRFIYHCHPRGLLCLKEFRLPIFLCRSDNKKQHKCTVLHNILHDVFLDKNKPVPKLLHFRHIALEDKAGSPSAAFESARVLAVYTDCNHSALVDCTDF